jgi:hypothetical protein
MRDFQDNPETKNTDYGLFLINHPDKLTSELFESLIVKLKGYICSFELIRKGNGRALVGFFPHFIQSQYPSLGLIEIEDYILGRGQIQNDPFVLSRQISLNDSFAWKLQSKKKTSDLEAENLNLELENDQYAAIQIVFEGSDQTIQITPRVIIKESLPHKKIDLIKKVKHQIEEKTSLNNNSSLTHAGVYDDYKKRTLVPKQVRPFIVTASSLKKFIV